MAGAVGQPRPFAQHMTLSNVERRPTISVVIPTHNRADLLESCIRSLQLALPVCSEIIVSDDGSTDDTAHRLARLRAEEPRLHWLSGPNSGPAGARNRGWRAARGAVVAFIDDDCTAEAGWGTALLDWLDAHPDHSGVEGRTCPAGTPRGAFVHTMESSGGSYLTCNIAFRRSALDTVGGFDERFPFPAGEDLELAHRVMKVCGPIGFGTAAVVRHALLAVGPGYYLRRVRFDPSIYRFFALHPEAFTPANSLARVPLLRPVSESRPPSVLQIFLYLASFRAHHAFRCLRDGPTLRDRLLGAATHLACIAASVGTLPASGRAHRKGLASLEQTSSAQRLPR